MEYQICDVAHKRCYSEREASNCLRLAKKHNEKYIPRRKYFCKYCGCWHLTSRTNEGDRQRHKPLKIIGGY